MATPARSSMPPWLLAGLLGGLLLPSAGQAQRSAALDEAPRPARLRVSPFIGWAGATSRAEQWSFPDPAGGFERKRVDMRLAGGFAAGATIEVAILGPLSLLTGVAYLDRDDAEFSIDGGERWSFASSRNLLLKAGGSIDLGNPDELSVRRLGASLQLAPFYMIERPRPIAGVADVGLFEEARHAGISFGFTGEIPLVEDRLAIHLGFDDYLTYWDEASLRRLPDWLRDAPAELGTTVEADGTHQWLVRAGLGIRFH